MNRICCLKVKSIQRARLDLSCVCKVMAEGAKSTSTLLIAMLQWYFSSVLQEQITIVSQTVGNVGISGVKSEKQETLSALFSNGMVCRGASCVSVHVTPSASSQA